MDRTKIMKTVLIALFAALIAVGAFIRIPLPPVPITLQTLFTLVSALLLPLSVSIPSVLVYLFLGIIGLPIFTSGGGLAAVTGPTGGYLIGLIPAVTVGGLMVRKDGKKPLWYYLLASFAATVAIYIPGLFWLGYSRHLTLSQTLAGGLTPFIIGDVIKMIVSSIVAYKLRPQVLTMLKSDAE
ncbi:MAG: biotin transporter BioY [Bullifex sp.]